MDYKTYENILKISFYDKNGGGNMREDAWKDLWDGRGIFQKTLIKLLENSKETKAEAIIQENLE